jgi:hypothetical protein
MRTTVDKVSLTLFEYLITRIASERVPARFVEPLVTWAFFTAISGSVVFWLLLVVHFYLMGEFIERVGGNFFLLNRWGPPLILTHDPLLALPKNPKTERGLNRNKNWIVRRPGAIRSEVGTADMKFDP